jgi:hypothetical protein
MQGLGAANFLEKEHNFIHFLQIITNLTLARKYETIFDIEKQVHKMGVKESGSFLQKSDKMITKMAFKAPRNDIFTKIPSLQNLQPDGYKNA